MLTLAPVDDIQGFASRLAFFGVVKVRGNQIDVALSPSYVDSVPHLPPG